MTLPTPSACGGLGRRSGGRRFARGCRFSRCAGRWLRLRSERLGERGDGDGTTLARLIEDLDREAVVRVVGRVEEEDVVVTRSEHASQPIWHFLEGEVDAVDLNRTVRTDPQDERRVRILVQLFGWHLFLLLLGKVDP